MSPFSLFPCRPLYAASFALLTSLTLSSCVSVRPSGDTGLVPFTSDGCSLFPDGTFEEREKWCDCCQTHDLAYWQGGSSNERARADAALRDCVLTRTGDKYLAETMYLGVKVGGSPAFPTWYRWGYGWPYGRVYQPLSHVERLQVQDMLAVYAKRHPSGYCVEKRNK